MIDLRLLKTFLTVLETGTYSQAAVKLDYAQSTVTKHMQLLEGAYHGTKLLRRQGARMVPTAEGLALQRYAEQILQLYEASCRDIAPPEKRVIRIGATNTLADTYLPLAISQLKAACPDVTIHLTNGNPQFLYGLLRSGQLDAMFVIDTQCRYRDFSVRQIRREPMVIAVPPLHPLSKKDTVSFDDIQDESFILTENGCSYRKLLLNEFSKHGLSPRIVMELDNAQATKQAILQKYGIGFLPALVVRRTDLLVPIPFRSEYAPAYSWIVYAPNGVCAQPLVDRIADSVLQVYPE